MTQSTASKHGRVLLTTSDHQKNKHSCSIMKFYHSLTHTEYLNLKAVISIFTL